MTRSDKTKLMILNAAEEEFSEKGLHGARVDEISARAGSNKRMIYAYFGSKEGLYSATLAHVYRRLNNEELHLLSDELTPKEAIGRLIELYFLFLKDNPSFVRMLMWENLNYGNYFINEKIYNEKDSAMESITKILNKSISEGVFKKDLDIDEVIISLNTYCFSYFSNRHTLSKVIDLDFLTPERLSKRIKTVTASILAICEE